MEEKILDSILEDIPFEDALVEGPVKESWFRIWSILSQTINIGSIKDTIIYFGDNMCATILLCYLSEPVKKLMGNQRNPVIMGVLHNVDRYFFFHRKKLKQRNLVFEVY